MGELFRFTIARSPQSVETGTTIDLGTDSPFQKQLTAAAGGGVRALMLVARGNSALVNVATAYLSTADFRKDIEALTLGTEIQSWISTISAAPPVGLAALDASVQQAFKISSTELVAAAQFSADEVRVKDSLTATYIAPAGHRIDMSGIADAVRAMALLRSIAAKSKMLVDADAVIAALDASMTVSPTVLPQGGTSIRPAGITDLLVVRQQITRYEKSEIQSIENIMTGESRRKTVRDTTTSQTTNTTESDTTTTVTKEADQTEQFSLQNEVDKALQEQLAVKAGASVSYHGGTVDASVNASVDYSQSKSDSQKIATNYAREVVSKAATQVVTATKQQLIQQLTQVTDTLEDHSFDNTKAGSANVSAVYQWLNKVYTAQIFNYGLRLIYDVIVPEPALQWIAAFGNPSSATGLPLDPPPSFTVDPSAINVNNFEGLAKTYRASGVPGPPEQFQIAAATAVAIKDANPPDAILAIKIPDGYYATTAWVSGQYDWTQNPNNSIELNFGETQLVFGQNSPAQKVDLTLKGSGDLPCTIHAYNISNYSVSVRVECSVAPETMLNWQQQVFDKLLAGWSSWKADYEDAFAKQQQAIEDSGDPKLGASEDENRAIERTEVKRSVLQLLLGDFNLSGVDDPTGFPHPKLPDAISQGEFVRFFEQAFEWEQISYVFYPYFWGDQSRWIKKLQLATDDPLFEAFLRAGSARVVVSVRPGFETALDYFFTFGTLWRGAAGPSITSSTYLPIAEEIREQTDALDEATYGKPWEVVLPTSLIRLRTDNKLPAWKQADPTKWVWTDDNPTD
jgi:hypothetical protein